MADRYCQPVLEVLKCKFKIPCLTYTLFLVSFYYLAICLFNGLACVTMNAYLFFQALENHPVRKHWIESFIPQITQRDRVTVQYHFTESMNTRFFSSNKVRSLVNLLHAQFLEGVVCTALVQQLQPYCSISHQRQPFLQKVVDTHRDEHLKTKTLFCPSQSEVLYNFFFSIDSDGYRGVQMKGRLNEQGPFLSKKGPGEKVSSPPFSINTPPPPLPFPLPPTHNPWRLTNFT